LRAPGKSKGRIAAPGISARLSGHVMLGAQPDGSITADIDGYSIGLGKFSAGVTERAQALRVGLPFDSFLSHGHADDEEVERLVRLLAQRGLLEYGLSALDDGKDQVVIEPQIPDYWPRTPELGNDDVVALSRFAYLRRRGNEMVLESPRAGALFKICDPRVAATLATLSAPHTIKQLHKQEGFPGVTLLALLLDCQILFKIEAAGNDGLRVNEGDDNLVLWDFHDLLFHTRSTEGRQANPLGGLYTYADVVAPRPAVRPPWPGKVIELREISSQPAGTISPLANLLRQRHSTREFDDGQPVTLAELSQFLDGTARVLSKWKSEVDLGEGGPVVDYTSRPYPSGGSEYELELYLSVANCEGLARGFYHYDADRHALVSIAVRDQELDAQFAATEFAMGTAATPQILITIAARFDRVSWKYSGIAYSLILKDVGALMQTFYLMATEMGLGGCAVGTNNIDLFARMTGVEFHIEGPVGQFALGRGAKLGG
jgi:SagB-type dehydrogenase family enzyme